MESSPEHTKDGKEYIAATQAQTTQSPHRDEARKGEHEIKQAQDSRFAAAITRRKPSPLSKSLLQLYPILLIAFLNSAANGFDGNAFGGVSALPNFETRFGTNVAASQGFLAALYILGMLHPRLYKAAFRSTS